jgi:hypothetical protein
MTRYNPCRIKTNSIRKQVQGEDIRDFGREGWLRAQLNLEVL